MCGKVIATCGDVQADAQRSKIGLESKVWVLKASIGEWFSGHVISVSSKSLRVEFNDGGIPCKKSVAWGSPHIRTIDDKPEAMVTSTSIPGSATIAGRIAACKSVSRTLDVLPSYGERISEGSCNTFGSSLLARSNSFAELSISRLGVFASDCRQVSPGDDDSQNDLNADTTKTQLPDESIRDQSGITHIDNEDFGDMKLFQVMRVRCNGTGSDVDAVVVDFDDLYVKLAWTSEGVCLSKKIARVEAPTAI